MDNTTAFTNASSTLSPSAGESSGEDPWTTATRAMYWVMFGLIIFFNSIVIGALVMLGHRRSRLHFFILNIAISDFLFGMFFVLKHAIEFTDDYQWHAGEELCKIVYFLSHVVLFGSNYIQVSTGIDRLLVVLDPFSSLTSPKRRLVMVGIAWVLSIVFASHHLVNAKTSTYKSKTYCQMEFTAEGWKIYVTLELLALYFIPVLIIIGCYFSIVVLIWKNSSFNQGAQQRSSRPDEMANQAQGRNISKAKIKSIKMTFAIVLVFLLCFAPYAFYNLMFVHGIIEYGPEQSFMQTLCTLNNAINPIIYIIFDFNSFKKLCSKPVRSETYSGTKLSTISWTQDA